jgi:hypothetical protein
MANINHLLENLKTLLEISKLQAVALVIALALVPVLTWMGPFAILVGAYADSFMIVVYGPMTLFIMMFVLELYIMLSVPGIVRRVMAGRGAAADATVVVTLAFPATVVVVAATAEDDSAVEDAHVASADACVNDVVIDIPPAESNPSPPLARLSLVWV